MRLAERGVKVRAFSGTVARGSISAFGRIRHEKKETPLAVRDRIVGFHRIPANELIPNSLNWRSHPEEQRTALRAVLEEIGLVGVALVRRRDDGRYEILDGHLRQEELGTQPIPCVEVDLDDAEGLKVLATYDPLGAMAKTDADRLKVLLTMVEWNSSDLDDLTKHLVLFEALDDPPDDLPDADAEPEHTCPRCGHQFSETSERTDAPAVRTSRERAAKAVKGRPCVLEAVGGCKGPIDAHHRDKDPLNNGDGNVVAACRAHHRLLDLGRIDLDNPVMPAFTVDGSGKRRYAFEDAPLALVPTDVAGSGE